MPVERHSPDKLTLPDGIGLGPKPGDDDDALDPADDGEDEIDPAFYANGGVVFSEDELGAFGELKGTRVLHLTYGCSEETLSLVNLGATVTEVGDDGSTAELADAAGLTVEFVEDDPGMLSDHFREHRAFDLVYSGFGALAWVDSIADWAAGIAAVLVPGGKLVLYEEHPFAYVAEIAESGGLQVANSYFGDYGDDTGGEDGPDPLAPDAPEMDPEAIEEALAVLDGEAGPSWTVGDLVGTLGQAGLAVIDLQEFGDCDRYETALDRLAESGAADEDLAKLPAALLLVAVRLPA